VVLVGTGEELPVGEDATSTRAGGVGILSATGPVRNPWEQSCLDLLGGREGRVQAVS
jgi:hypothetical protein